MTILEELKNLKVAIDGKPSNADTMLEALNEISEAKGGQANGNTIAEAIKNIVDTEHPDVNLQVRPAKDADGDLFGKVASDLQEHIVVSNNAITGTLKYIADYSSAFSGAEAYGNYIAIKCTAKDGAVIKAEVVGGLHGEVTLDSDGLLVARIAGNTQSIRVSATKDGVTETQIFALNNLVLTLNDDKEVNSVTVQGVSATKDANDDWAVTLPSGTTAIDTVAVVLHAPNADYTLTPESYTELVDGDIKTFNLRVVAQDGSHSNYQITCTIAE